MIQAKKKKKENQKTTSTSVNQQNNSFRQATGEELMVTKPGVLVESYCKHQTRKEKKYKVTNWY